MNSMTDDRCRICGNDRGNRNVVAREVMYGFRERFDYLECSDCGCLQIRQVPQDIGKYYSETYYSYEPRDEDRLGGGLRAGILPKALKAARLDLNLKSRSIVARVLSPGYRRRFGWIKPNTVTRKSAILDVGCG
jgi:hypothetical protein